MSYKSLCEMQVCPDHGEEDLIEYLQHKRGVYRMYAICCEAITDHNCNCELCDITTEECNYYASWRLFDQIDEILAGDGSAPLIDDLINKKIIFPNEAYLRLFD